MNAKNVQRYITRKTLLYKTGVEYGDYTINHVLGCSHGCKYPCYAMMLAKRFGKIKNYEEWIEPQLVENAVELLESEIPKYKSKIKSVHFCFTTDPFMYGYPEITKMTLRLLNILNREKVKFSLLTKGIIPLEVLNFNKENEYGITLVSTNESFRNTYEPYSASYSERIECLYRLHTSGFKTWVSVEPYPTPNIVEQNIVDVLDKVKFVDKIVFGRMNYNNAISKYPNYKQYYNDISYEVIEYCKRNQIECYIKKGTIRD